jgi:ABC-2 type transport system ATP-binding protein
MRAAAERDAAVMVSSHHLDQLARVADRISVLHRGRLIGTLDTHGTDLEQEFFDIVYRDDRERGLA